MCLETPVLGHFIIFKKFDSHHLLLLFSPKSPIQKHFGVFDFCNTLCSPVFTLSFLMQKALKSSFNAQTPNSLLRRKNASPVFCHSILSYPNSNVPWRSELLFRQHLGHTFCYTGKNESYGKKDKEYHTLHSIFFNDN